MSDERTEDERFTVNADGPVEDEVTLEEEVTFTESSPVDDSPEQPQAAYPEQAAPVYPDQPQGYAAPEGYPDQAQGYAAPEGYYAAQQGAPASYPQTAGGQYPSQGAPQYPTQGAPQYPTQGMPQGAGYAYNPEGGYGWSPKSKLAAGLFGIFLGTFGVHNFYLGFTGKAVAQLLITVLSFGILSVVSAIWGLIEGILILSSATGTEWSLDAERLPMRPIGSL